MQQKQSEVNEKRNLFEEAEKAKRDGLLFQIDKKIESSHFRNRQCLTERLKKTDYFVQKVDQVKEKAKQISNEIQQSKLNWIA